MAFIVGLTGGIGSGKSSVSQIFTDLDADVIDTDKIARELTQPLGTAIATIKREFGNSFITETGSLDRRRMRELVFSDNISRQKLENILHPLIREEVVQRIKLVQSIYTILVVPLLIETEHYDGMTQRILVIDCDEMQQITRTMARSQLSEQAVRAIMATQISRHNRLQKADDIITNNQDINHLKEQVKNLHKKYLTLSNSQ